APGTGDDRLRLFEGLEDLVALGLTERVAQGARWLDWFRDRGARRMGLEFADRHFQHRTTRHDDAALDHVLQLADVAGPLAERSKCWTVTTAIPLWHNRMYEENPSYRRAVVAERQISLRCQDRYRHRSSR